MKISKQILINLKACPEGIDKFIAVAGEQEQEVTLDLCLKCAQVVNWDWAACTFLSTQAREPYHKYTVLADVVYIESTVQAYELWLDFITPASKLFDGSIAPARKLFDDSIAPARKLSDETKARAFWDALNIENVDGKQGK